MTGASPSPASGLSITIPLADFALGGTERIAIRLANAWRRDGAVVAIFAGSPAGPLAALVEEGVTVRIPEPAVPRGARRPRAAFVRAAARFAAAEARTHWFVPGNYHWPVARAIAAAPERPVVVAQVSAALRKPQRGPVRQILFDRHMRHLLGHVDGVVTLDEPTHVLAEALLGEGRATTIPLPALADDGPPPQPPAGGPPLIVAAGRLVPEKGFADLIDAMAALRNGQARLEIVGDGPERARLARRVAAHGLAGRVRLTGYVASTAPALARARLFVLSSWFEGFPAVLVEALAAGRPVVATDCTPATRLLAAPGAGAVVPPRDPVALAAAIDAALAAPPPDPARLAALVAAHRIGPAARAYLELFAALADRRTGRG